MISAILQTTRQIFPTFAARISGVFACLATKVGNTKNLHTLRLFIFINLSSLMHFVMPMWSKSLKLNVESLYMYFITKRESCFEFMYYIDRLLVEW